MQTRALIRGIIGWLGSAAAGIFILCLVIISPNAAAQVPATGSLQKADSLFIAKQYTQAFELYHTIYESKQYSASMLLRMAYIQEGLGHLGESLYYINLYYLATDDAQALKKMEELAKKNNLEGYETSETLHIIAWFQEQYTTLAMSLASIAVFLLALIYYQRIRKHSNASLTGIALVFTLALLFAHINFSLIAERGVVASPRTYLMSGPSSGSSVVAIISEGHQLKIRGKKDIWLEVDWKDQSVYVRESQLRPVRL